MKYHIDKTSESLLCRMCGEIDESVQHITSELERSAQKIQRTTRQCCKKSSLGYL